MSTTTSPSTPAPLLDSTSYHTKLYPFRIFLNPDLPDIIIISSDGLPGHRTILTDVTYFFESALPESSRFIKSTTNAITLTDHPSDAVKAFLEFCYPGSYDTMSSAKVSFDKVRFDFNFGPSQGTGD